MINLYKPVLNGTDNQAGMSNLIQICEPDWIEFETAFPKIENNSSDTSGNNNIPTQDGPVYITADTSRAESTLS